MCLLRFYQGQREAQGLEAVPVADGDGGVVGDCPGEGLQLGLDAGVVLAYGVHADDGGFQGWRQ